ncbi:flavoprotein-like protein [Penicillium chermesinum]|uniref:Flavoprotein-like protein n=1 Tax=Penicillium chermesinum TaxID=63820 RepID=A0A9W9TX86_9EURO|nr:flavoprotein-like protein [Penicillium chermesinum]KAJ5247075.1 flavoprotein-like protein [Penicillium chermesinum]
MSPAHFRVGIICGSTRTPRVGDQITDFVLETIKSHEKAKQKDTEEIQTNPSFEFDYIDINDLYSAEDYTHEHTRAWSRRVSALDAFVFVTAQYNWGIPAPLKNAIDFLFNEWKGKPAMIVSYGGHGGGKAAAALKLCLAGGIDMRVGDRMVVSLSFPDREVLYQAVRGEKLGLDAESTTGVWSSERGHITGGWDEMIGMLRG